MYFHFKPIICSLLVGCISFSSIAYAIDNTSDTIISSTKTSSINNNTIVITSENDFEQMSKQDEALYQEQLDKKSVHGLNWKQNQFYGLVQGGAIK